MSVYEQVKQALQDIVAPELKAIQVEIKRLDSRIDSLKSEMTAEIGSLRKEMTSETNSLKMVLAAEIRRLDEKVDRIDERIDTAGTLRIRPCARSIFIRRY